MGSLAEQVRALKEQNEARAEASRTRGEAGRRAAEAERGGRPIPYGISRLRRFEAGCRHEQVLYYYRVYQSNKQEIPPKPAALEEQH